MKNIFKRTFIMLILGFFMVTLFPSYAASEIIFTSVNDQLFELSANTMPIRKNGTYYVPYKVFTYEPNGNSPFGLNGIYNSALQTLVVYDWDNTLTFQIAHGYVYDEKMNTYSQPAYFINNTVYVPVSLLANKFGLSYSIIPSVAPIVRITNSKANLSDDTFAYVAEVDNGLEQKIKEYKDSLKDTSGSSTNSGSSSNETGNNQNPQKPEKIEIRPSAVYLTFEGELNDNTEEILNVLSDYDRKGTFFIGTENIAINGDLIRRIVGEGHSIGLSVSNTKLTSSEDFVSTLNKSNQKLAEICGVTTRLVRIEGGSRNKLEKAYLDALVQEGYRLWDYTLDSGDTKTGNYSRRASSTVINAFEKTSKPSVVRLGQTNITASALKRILSYMQDKNIYSVIISESDTPVNFYRELR